MKSSRSTWVPSLIIAIALLTGSIQPGRSQDAATPPSPPEGQGVVFGVYPQGGAEGQFFEADVEPGASHDFTLALLNAGVEELTLLTYPADAYSMNNGGLGVHFMDAERTAPTTWLTFPEGTVAIAPGQEYLIPFTATVPEGTPPGQYVTAIGVETVDSYAVGEASPFRQVFRKVIAVAIVVPGPVEAAFVLGTPELEARDGQTVLRVPVENTGNIRVRPTGSVTLSDASGGELATGEVAMGSVYMGDTAPYELWMPTALPDGAYSVSIQLIDPDTGAEASLEHVALSLVTPVEATPVAETPSAPAPTPPEAQPTSVFIEAAEIVANADPIQFANVTIAIENTGAHVSRARVTLTISKNGVFVEDLVLDDNLPLPVGTTSAEQRYIPPTGWESGTWTFAVTVHTINPNADVETVLVPTVDVATIVVP